MFPVYSLLHDNISKWNNCESFENIQLDQNEIDLFKKVKKNKFSSKHGAVEMPAFDLCD